MQEFFDEDWLEAEGFETEESINGAKIVGSKIIKDYTGVEGTIFSEETMNIEITELVRLQKNAELGTSTNGFTALTSYVATMKVQGEKNKDICRKMKITPQQLSFITNSDLFAEIVAGMTYRIADSARVMLVSATMKATTTIIGLLDSPDPKMRYTAAKDILDRTGLKTADEYVLKTEKLAASGDVNDDVVDALMYGIDEIMKSRARIKGEENELSDDTEDNRRATEAEAPNS